MTRVAVVEREHRPRGRTEELLYDPLRVTGVEGVHLLDGDSWPDDAGLLWLVGSANWYPKTWHRLGSLAARERPRVLLWHTEPLPLPRAARLRLAPLQMRELARIVLRDPRRSDPISNWHGLCRVRRDELPDVLVVPTVERQLFLDQFGVDSEFVPLGYDRELYGFDLGLERDIDVLVIGARDGPRRRRMLRALRRDGVAARVIDSNCSGAARTELLNRTKILLNLPRHPGMLSAGRMMLGMANKALVVADPIYRPDPYEPGVHYVSAPVAEWPETIPRLLADDAERARITDAAYELVRSLRMEDSVARLLALTGAQHQPD